MASKFLAAAIVVLALCAATVSAVTTIEGYKTGCTFTAILVPYTGSSYNGSAVFMNNWTESWNAPFLLFNGKSSLYTWNIPGDVAAAGVIGQLPDNTNLVGLTNYDAFSKAKSFNRYQAQYHVGSTFYGFASQEYAGSVQFAFQVTNNQFGKNIEITIAVFMANTNSRTLECVQSLRSTKITGKCPLNRQIRQLNQYCKAF